MSTGRWEIVNSRITERSLAGPKFARRHRSPNEACVYRAFRVVRTSSTPVM